MQFPGVQLRMIFIGHFFFSNLKKNINFCFVFAIVDLVHDVEAIHGLCLLPTAPGNLY